MNRKLTFFLTMIFLISFSSAAVETLGVFQQRSCVELLQSGVGFSHCNVTSVRLNNQTSALGETPMTKTGIEYNLTFCDTDNIGQYIVNGFCTNTTDTVAWAYDFDVNQTGTDFTTAQGIVYIVFLVAIIAVFIFITFAAFSFPWAHKRSEEGWILQFNDLRFVKIFLFVVSYLLLMFIFGIMRSITANFLSFDNASKVFTWLYWTMFSFLWPLLVLGIVVMIINFVGSLKMKEALMRGVPIK